jgi:proton glutamate symport protein
VTVGSKGVGVLFGLGKLIVTMYVALVLFIVLVLGAVIIIFRIPLRPFYRAVREPFLIAFSTASSEAALPLALERMEKFGVPKHIVSFVIPTGYSFNLDGTTLYLSMASIFVAQAAGANLSFGQQLLMMITLMLTSKGVAGVPRAALVILAGTLATFQLPMEGAAVLLGVDAILDMARTSTNVLGNCLASAVIARWEGHKVG